MTGYIENLFVVIKNPLVPGDPPWAWLVLKLMKNISCLTYHRAQLAIPPFQDLRRREGRPLVFLCLRGNLSCIKFIQIII